MSEVVIHRLLNKDPETMTGECSVCGLVAIAKAGNGYQCGVKKKAAQKSWRKRNPGKSAADRRRRSEHQLFNRDYLKLTAECVRCGPVAMTPWGRGYACGKRAEELRTRQQQAPQEFCGSCWAEQAGQPRRVKVYLHADGTCPRCDNPASLDLGAELRDMEYGYRRSKEMDGVSEGMHVAYEDEDPYFIPDYESAVAGWQTLGSDRPWNEV